ncbi:hypothetical protein [Tateyamaria sp. ANG-S1]|uniref:hypothetical protein n=1 Tax=Tateyamaria sp. ANG-S1 TaxID=1577905 RepID=UPI00057CF43A|nr:hypothetical protein [Tateyamaria sp. ANG-S1]KIC51317.1 hypothetical protein RA29_05695 [Tateyamaria sp. ANG-S1]
MSSTDQAGTNHTTTNSGGKAELAFVVGILVVVVAVLAYAVFSGEGASGDDVSITIEGAGAAIEGAGSALEDAANAVEGAASGEGN